MPVRAGQVGDGPGDPDDLDDAAGADLAAFEGMLDRGQRAGRGRPLAAQLGPGDLRVLTAPARSWLVVDQPLAVSGLEPVR